MKVFTFALVFAAALAVDCDDCSMFFPQLFYIFLVFLPLFPIGGDEVFLDCYFWCILEQQDLKSAKKALKTPYFSHLGKNLLVSYKKHFQKF